MAFYDDDRYDMQPLPYSSWDEPLDSWDGSVDPEDIYEELYGERDRPFKKKKNAKKYCRGRVGREHKPVIEVNRKYGWRDYKCGPSRWMKDYWICHHHEVCSECGKELKFNVECPDRG